MESVKIITAGERLTWISYSKSVLQNVSLIYILAKRDIKIKFAQSVLGVFWILIQPVIGVVLFTLVVGNWLKLPLMDYPYPLFAFTGVMGWNFFSYMVTAGGTSLSDSRDLIQRISFPRIVLPISKVLVGLFDLIISLSLLILLVPVVGLEFGFQVICLPIFILLLIFSGLAFSIWLSALTIRFRDFHHIIPYVVNFGIWITPVFYPMEIVPVHFRFIMCWNPIAFAVEGFRWCLFKSAFSPTDFIPSIVLIAVLILSGLFYFRNVEKEIVDTI